MSFLKAGIVLQYARLPKRRVQHYCGDTTRLREAGFGHIVFVSDSVKFGESATKIADRCVH